MKKIVSLVLMAAMLVVSMLSFASCGAAGFTLEKIKAEGKLTVYTEAGFAPYEFVYEEKVVGVDIEIMQKVADKIGVLLDVQDVNFDTICTAVQSGKAMAGAAAITIRPDRQEQVAFSKPYTSTEQYVIVAAAAEIPTVEALKGKKIGAQEGTTSDFLVDGLIKDGTLEGSELTPYKAPALAAAALGSKIDAVVTDKLTAQIIVSGSNGAYHADKLVKNDGSDAAEVEEYGIAVAKGSEELLAVINEVITELLQVNAESGKTGIAELEAKYNALAAPEEN